VVRREDPGWQPNPGWRGDGTVPAISAVPPELAGSEDLGHPLRDRHSPMSGPRGWYRWCGRWWVTALDGVRGVPVEGLQLGVDLDDAAVAGQPVTVGARLEGEPGATAAGNTEGGGGGVGATAGPGGGGVGAWLRYQTWPRLRRADRHHTRDFTRGPRHYCGASSREPPTGPRPADQNLSEFRPGIA